jgi:hypothetical protein
MCLRDNYVGGMYVCGVRCLYGAYMCVTFSVYANKYFVTV